MITHHRHVHIKSYEKSYKNFSYNKYYNPAQHDEFRKAINERAKRVILKKHRKFLIENNFKREHFLALEENSTKTLSEIDKYFSLIE